MILLSAAKPDRNDFEATIDLGLHYLKRLE
jgi:hypothetical protein